MPTLNWSRAGRTERGAKLMTGASAVLAVALLVGWASGGVRWLLYGGLLWAAAAAAGVATAAGLLPEGKRRGDQGPPPPPRRR
jgi:hypothetical protein